MPPSTSNKPIQEYEKRLCITYLDETEPYLLKDFTTKAIVSLTALKNKYCLLEDAWKRLRAKYNVPSGQYLHFTDVKQLLKPDKSKYKPEFSSLFSDKSGSIDYDKLHNFYSDVLDIINTHDFIVQATGTISNKLSKAIPGYVKNNSEMYRIFREHFDKIAFYLLSLTDSDYKKRVAVHSSKGNSQKATNEKIHYYLTKLRYDGSYEFTDRNDFRNVFASCITDGTTVFKSETIKSVFDTLSFIPKSEVGLVANCANPCDLMPVIHAGSEIIDFISIYVARDMFKDLFKKIYLQDHSYADTMKMLNDLAIIKIPNKQDIVPTNIIKNRLFSTQDISPYKTIINYPY